MDFNKVEIIDKIFEEFQKKIPDKFFINDLIEFLPIDEIDKLDLDGNTLLHNACKFGFNDTINLLITLNANIDNQNDEGITPLLQCINDYNKKMTDKCLDRIKMFIKANANPNIVDENGLCPAMSEIYFSIIEY